MTFLGTVGRLIAFGVVVVAVVIAVAPKIVYTELPEDLTLDFAFPATMVVTGANSGVGLATVQHFAHNSQMTIIMGCRSMKRCQDAKAKIFRILGSGDDEEEKENAVHANLILMQLDLSDKMSIEAFAKNLKDQPIHVLINNAGLAGATKQLSYHEEDGVENHIRVNHLGHVYLTHCLWKNLKLAEQGARIVVVSSLVAGMPKNIPTLGWYKGEEYIRNAANLKLYGRSKRANLMFAAELHQRYGGDPQNSGITVTAAHPGWSASDLCKNGCKGEREAVLGVANFANSGLFTGSIQMSASNGALPQVYAAVVPQGGVYLGPKWLLVGEPVIAGGLTGSWHHASFTKDESQALWTKSLAAMQIKEFGEFEIPSGEPDSKPERVHHQEEQQQQQQQQQHEEPVEQQHEEPMEQHQREIPVREEPVHREDEPVQEEGGHHQHEAEPEPAHVYEESEVNDQAYDEAAERQQQQREEVEQHHQHHEQHEHHEQQHQQHAQTQHENNGEDPNAYTGDGPYDE